jgi:predicted TIM-barrel enzyme
MSNVLQLFKQEKIENPPEPKTIVAIAVASILSSKGQLARAVEELSKHLDAVGQTIDALGDTDPRIRVVHAAKLDRKRLTKAMLELSQAAEKLSAIQQELAEAVAHRTGQTANQAQLETVTDGQQRPEPVSMSVNKIPPIQSEIGTKRR